MIAMEKHTENKKRYLYICLVLVILAGGLLLFLPVDDISAQGAVGRHSVKSAETAETTFLVDFTDRTKLWWCTEVPLAGSGQGFTFQVKYYVAQGELTLTLYDITDGEYDENGFLLAASCQALETRTYAESGTDVWDMSQKPGNRRYAVSPNCSKDCLFDLRSRIVQRVPLWRWLYHRLKGVQDVKE